MSEAQAGRAPRLSVLMPSYNSGRFIEHSIASVLDIPGLDVELVIQDGGSSDDTAAVIERIGDPRISFVSEPDNGQSDALNRALARARGDWIGWLNADDVYLKEGVTRLAAQLDGELDFLYGDYATIDAGGEQMARYESSRPLTPEGLIRYGVYVNCSAGLYRRELLRSLGGWDPSLELCMDLDLLCRIARNGARTRHVPVVVMQLRSHPDAKTALNRRQIASEAWRIYRRYGRDIRGALPRALAGQAIFQAYLATYPIWQTRAWRRIRAGKRL